MSSSAKSRTRTKTRTREVCDDVNDVNESQRVPVAASTVASTVAPSLPIGVGIGIGIGGALEDCGLQHNQRQKQQQQQQRREQFDALHQEMELVSHGIAKSGHAKRKIPRVQSKVRTQKRKLLERQEKGERDHIITDDIADRSRNNPSSSSKQQTQPRMRMRGSKAAVQESVVEDSFILAPSRKTTKTSTTAAAAAAATTEKTTTKAPIVSAGGPDAAAAEERQFEFDNRCKSSSDEDESDTNNDNDNDNAFHQEPEDYEYRYLEQDDDFALEQSSSCKDLLQEPSQESIASTSTGLAKKLLAAKKKSSPQSSNACKSRGRRPKLLRNFRSCKMAEQHGAALGELVRGKPNLAIRKLKKVAASAPAAPQVYSSLGMVYEDMLQESQRKNGYRGVDVGVGNDKAASNGFHDMKSQPLKEREHSGTSDGIHQRVSLLEADECARDETQSVDIDAQDNVLREQLDLAKKAYASFHIAAIFCKRDFSLWLRAADSASEIAGLHTTTMLLPGITNDVLQYHRAEKQRWLEEAKNDYQMADNLKPPGIDIPAKLALTMMELGCLSEALTLMTDLKKHKDFDSSYRAWVLYADIMLRIGHECSQWNRNVRTNNNHMFRRWLRKWSDSFDWQERRLQALIKALEAACGTRSCEAILNWLQNHVASIGIPNAEETNDSPSSSEVEEDGNDSLNPDTEMIEKKDTGPSTDFANTTNDVDQRINSVDGTELPLSASCRTVFSIASELMRQMINMQLFDGGRLTGESIFLYLKERVRLREERLRLLWKFNQDQQRPIDIFAMNREAYDAPDEHSDDDDNERNLEPLSDDDNFDRTEEHDVGRLFKKGVLPPEIKFLYGLCLAGEGGKVFLAVACIKAAKELPSERISWLLETTVDPGVTPDANWIIFCRDHTDQLGQVSALAFGLDVLWKIGIKSTLSEEVSLLVRELCFECKRKGLLDSALQISRSDTVLFQHRRNQLLKIVVAGMSYEISPTSFLTPSATKESIDSMSSILPILWKVEVDGSISQTNCEAIKILSCLFHFQPDTQRTTIANHDVCCEEDVLSKITQCVSLLCGSTNFNSLNTVTNEFTTFTAFPLTTRSWLTSDFESLAVRTFNLCVGMNIPRFSGWTPFEYSSRFFIGDSSDNLGIFNEKGFFSGCIEASHEVKLARLWALVEVYLHGNLGFDFQAKLITTKDSQWYKEARSRFHAIEVDNRVFFQENCGLLVLLCFAESLLVALSQSNASDKNILMALSIMLPISQFCLNEILWDSEIGRSDESWPTGKLIRDVQYVDTNIPAPSFRQGYIRPSKRVSSLQSESERSLHEWFSWEDGSDPMSNLIGLPLSFLNKTWGEAGGRNPNRTIFSTTAAEAMNDVNLSIAKLRSSYTMQAVEKASMQISISLLRLAAHPECRNPFLCLQQAAMFACLSPKGGTGDNVYQSKLPSDVARHPMDILLVIGRADCLNAIHFCQEAAFLCCFAARICGINRRNYGRETEEGKQWDILAAMAYDLSVMIRIVSTALLSEQEKREETTGTWDVPVIEEFNQARLFALDIRKELFTGKHPHQTATNKDCENFQDSGHRNQWRGDGTMGVFEATTSGADFTHTSIEKDDDCNFSLTAV